MQTPTLCVMALLDEDSCGQIASLRNTLTAHGLPNSPLPPHVTLGVYESAPERDILAWTARFAATQPPLSVRINHLGIFAGGTCFAALLVNAPLLAIHSGYHQYFDDTSGKKGQLYTLETAQWVPHCTLFSGPPQQAKAALPALATAFTPFTGRIVGLMVGHFIDKPQLYSPMEEIECFPLQGL